MESPPPPKKKEEEEEEQSPGRLLHNRWLRNCGVAHLVFARGIMVPPSALLGTGLMPLGCVPP